MTNSNQPNITVTATSFFSIINRVVVITLLIGCTVLVCNISPGMAEGEKIPIYFHNTESPHILDFSWSKKTFDTYLSQLGRYEFLPFKKSEDFEQALTENPNGLVVLPGWYYTSIQQKYALKPIFLGRRNGKITQKRILVATEKSAPTLDLAKTRTIAAAGSDQYIRNILREMFQDEKVADSVKIFPCPKETDAVLAPSFGLAQSALVTENSFEALKISNPNLYKEMKILATGPESFLLIVAVPEHFVNQAEILIKILQNMPIVPDGEENMKKIFGLDSWQEWNLLNQSKPEN
jgi:hypothetical protein